MNGDAMIRHLRRMWSTISTPFRESWDAMADAWRADGGFWESGVGYFLLGFLMPVVGTPALILLDAPRVIVGVCLAVGPFTWGWMVGVSQAAKRRSRPSGVREKRRALGSDEKGAFVLGGLIVAAAVLTPLVRDNGVLPTLLFVVATVIVFAVGWWFGWWHEYRASARRATQAPAIARIPPPRR